MLTTDFLILFFLSGQLVRSSVQTRSRANLKRKKNRLKSAITDDFNLY